MITNNNKQPSFYKPIEIEPIKIRMYPDGRMDAKNAATYIGLSVKTLAMMRCNGTGPNYIKPGRVFYYEEHIKDWLQKQGQFSSTEQCLRFHSK